MMVSEHHITNRQNCSPEEIQRLIQYLEATPVAWVADKIRRGAALSKGEIQSREYLGALVTIFSKLGSDLGLIVARQRYGREKFLVREILPTLRDPQCVDEDARSKVECYMKLDTLNSLEIIITIYQYGTDCIVVDGNKRASACYEGRSSMDFRPVPVYLVSL